MLRLFVCTLLGLTTGVVKVNSQVFSTYPVDSTILQGGTVDFRCRLNGVYPCNNIHWVKYVGSGSSQYRAKKYVSSCASLNDRRTFDETRYSVAKQNINEYRLEIRDVRPSDAGDYGCIVYDTVSNMNIPSGTASLTVLNTWPTPICQASPSHATVGSTVRFTCSVPPGSPTLPLSWTNKKAVGFGGTKSVAPGETNEVYWRLQSIENYEKFTCISGYGDTAQKCSVSPLQIPPTPIMSPVVVRKVVGENADFSCNVIINTPSIKSKVWFVVDGEQNLRRFKNSSGRYLMLDDNSSFRIQKLTAKDNNTHVWCTAKNEKGIYSAATGTARLVVMPPKESPIITFPVDKPLPTSSPTDAITTSMHDISASDTMDTRGHSASVAGGTTAAIFLVLVVVALWVYMVKGRVKSMDDSFDSRLHHGNKDSRPLTVMIPPDQSYGSAIPMHAIEPPISTSNSSLFTSAESLTSRHDRTDYDIVQHPSLQPRADTMSRARPLAFMSSSDFQNKTQTLPSRHGRDRKIHTVCMAYQDHRGTSSLPGSPMLSRAKTKRRGTAATGNMRLDLKARLQPAADYRHSGNSHPRRSRSSHKLSRQEAIVSIYSDPRAASLPNSPLTARTSRRRRNTKDDVVLYALPLQSSAERLEMRSCSKDQIDIENGNVEMPLSKTSRIRSSFSKTTKRSFANTLSLSEMKLISSKKPMKIEHNKRRNVEGLVYAELDLKSCNTSDKVSILGNEDRTIYADIRGITMDL